MTNMDVFKLAYKERMMGKFVIGRRIFEDDPGLVRYILSHVAVMEANLDWASNSIEYTATSPLFKKTVPGEIVRHYTVYIKVVNDPVYGKMNRVEFA